MNSARPDSTSIGGIYDQTEQAFRTLQAWKLARYRGRITMFVEAGAVRDVEVSHLLKRTHEVYRAPSGRVDSAREAW